MKLRLLVTYWWQPISMMFLIWSIILSNFWETICQKKNVAGVLTPAFLTDQEKIFESAYKFLFELRIDNQIVETEAWKKLHDENPVLASKMLSKAVFKL